MIKRSLSCNLDDDRSGRGRSGGEVRVAALEKRVRELEAAVSNANRQCTSSPSSASASFILPVNGKSKFLLSCHFFCRKLQCFGVFRSTTSIVPQKSPFRILLLIPKELVAEFSSFNILFTRRSALCLLVVLARDPCGGLFSKISATYNQ